MRLLIYYSKDQMFAHTQTHTHTIEISWVSTLDTCTYIIELNIYLTFHEKWIKCTLVQCFISMSSFKVNTSLLVCRRLLVLLPWVQTHQHLWTTTSTSSRRDYWMNVEDEEVVVTTLRDTLTLNQTSAPCEHNRVFWRAWVSGYATAGQLLLS